MTITAIALGYITLKALALAAGIGGYLIGRNVEGEKLGKVLALSLSFGIVAAYLAFAAPFPRLLQALTLFLLQGSWNFIASLWPLKKGRTRRELRKHRPTLAFLRARDRIVEAL